MKNWFNDFEVTIAAGGVEPIRQSGRIVRITDIEGGTEVAAKVDGTGWAKIEAGMSSPDTVEPFKTLYLRNDSAAEITVKGWVSYGRGTDDRKKLLGAVTIDDSDPVSVTETKNIERALLGTVSLAGAYVAIDSTTLQPDTYSRLEFYFEDGGRCVLMKRTTYEKIHTFYDRDNFAMANGPDLVASGIAGKLYIWGVKNG